MFSIALPDYPTTTQANTTAFQLPNNSSNSFAFSIAPETNTSNYTALPTTVNATNITATLPPNLQLASVTYAGINYPVGSFTYDSLTGFLAIPNEGNGNLNIAIAYSTINNNIIRTTDIIGVNVSQFLQYWNIQGNITINRSFGGHPSLSLNFKVPRSIPRSQIENQLCPSLVKNIKGKWRITNLSITEFPRNNNWGVSLNASGVHASYADPSRSLLDKPLRLKENGYQKYISLSQFASRAGVIYLGANLEKRVPKSTSSQEFTTFRQEIESRAIVGNGFVYYDDHNKIQIKTFGNQSVHYIADDDVIESVTTNYKGTGAEVTGIKLAHELRNCELKLQFDEDDKITGGITTRWEFENAESLFQCTLAAEPNGFALVQPNVDTLRNMSRNFDVGGFTKTARQILEFNGLPLLVIETVYGYSYSSADTNTPFVFQNSASGFTQINITFDGIVNPQTLWGVVKQTTSNYFYNSEGYLIKVENTGFKKARLKQESESKECVRLLAEAISAYVQGGGAGNFILSSFYNQTELFPIIVGKQVSVPYTQALAYAFKENLPINDLTEYSLSTFRQYYDDIQVPESDPDWVEPKFYNHKIRSQKDTIVRDDPNSTQELVLPPITVVEVKEESDRVYITKVSKPERFTRKTSSKNQSGEGGKNAIALGNSIQNIGRPSVHTKLDRTVVTPNENNNYQAYKDYKFWLDTPESGSDYKVTEKTISYPDVDEPSMAIAATETEYSIKNSRDCVTLSLKILYRPGIEVGDFAIWRNNRYIVFGIAENYTTENQRIKGILTLNLGLYIDINIDDRQVLINQNNTFTQLAIG